MKYDIGELLYYGKRITELSGYLNLISTTVQVEKYLYLLCVFNKKAWEVNMYKISQTNEQNGTPIFLYPNTLYKHYL